MTGWHARVLRHVLKPLAPALDEDRIGADWCRHQAQQHVERGELPEARRCVADYLDDSSSGGSVCG